MAANNTPSQSTQLVLAVSSDPERVGIEFVEHELNRVRERFGVNNKLEMVAAPAKDENELRDQIAEYRPSILHITAHGSPSWDFRLPMKSLSRQLSRVQIRPDCVVFNGCDPAWNRNRYRTAARRVILHKRPTETDDTAILFAERFYEHVAQSIGMIEAIDTLGEALQDIPQLGKVRTIVGREDRPAPVRRVRPDTTIEYESVSEAARLPGPAKTTQLAKDESDHNKVTDPRNYVVWYATDRKPSPTPESNNYGGERDDLLHYGVCNVCIPQTHKIGSIGSSFWKRWLKGHDDRLKIVSRTPLDPNEYWNKMNHTLSELSSTDRGVLLYIHGYRTKFDDAILRAAQIGFDIKYPGITAAFSWPSQGKLKAYMADEETITVSEHRLRDYVIDLSERSGATALHVIVHSMGNRALLRSIPEIAQALGNKAMDCFKHIFLAAPDVDRGFFLQRAGDFSQVCKRTTMYVSSRDKALRSSGILHDYERAGYTPPVTRVHGIDTVEVTEIDLSFMGHGYIATLRPVLTDMHNIIHFDAIPSSRMGLRRIDAPPPPWWRIGK